MVFAGASSILISSFGYWRWSDSVNCDGKTANDVLDVFCVWWGRVFLLMLVDAFASRLVGSWMQKLLKDERLIPVSVICSKVLYICGAMAEIRFMISVIPFKRVIVLGIVDARVVVSICGMANIKNYVWNARIKVINGAGCVFQALCEQAIVGSGNVGRRVRH